MFYFIDAMLVTHILLLILIRPASTEDNIALGALCCASSEHSSPYSCDNAVDGRETERSFASWSQGVGLWLLLQFDGTYLIDKIRLMDRQLQRERNKDVQLRFSDGSVQSVTLPNPSNGFYWNNYTLIPVASQWIKIVVMSVHRKANNGWTEVQVFGVPHQEAHYSQRYVSYHIQSHTGVLPMSVYAGTQADLLRHQECPRICVQYTDCLAASMEVLTGDCRPIFHDCLLAKLEVDASFVLWKPKRG